MAKKITGRLAVQIRKLQGLLAEDHLRLQLIARSAASIANTIGGMGQLWQHLSNEEAAQLKVALSAVSGRGDRFDVEPSEGDTRTRRRTRPAQPRRR